MLGYWNLPERKAEAFLALSWRRPLTRYLIPQTVLSAMEASEQQDKTALQTLIERVRGRKMLLILDNCEHLIEICAKLVETLLGSAPGLKILASSREALGVKGEMAWHVSSMSLPVVGSSVPLDELSRFESVRLFVERAMLAKPRFQLTKDNASFIAQICSRLDGIPLAIELATVRVRALSVEQIASRLDDRFHLAIMLNQGSAPSPDVVVEELMSGHLIYAGSMYVGQTMVLQFPASPNGRYRIMIDPQNQIIEEVTKPTILLPLHPPQPLHLDTAFLI